MESKELTPFDVLLGFLVLHLFSVHSKLLYHINPDAPAELPKFSFLSLNEFTVTAMIFALGYSIMTAITIKIIDLNFESRWARISPILALAVMDAMGVLIGYHGVNYRVLGSIYYAFYTLIIVASIALVKEFSKKIHVSEISSELQVEISASDSEIIARYQSGNFTQKQIAEMYNLSESKVSRILKSIKK